MGKANIPLFAYGTLSDPEIRAVLFGCEVDHGSSHLLGHRIMSKGGFFLVAPSASHRVCGELLFLSADQLSIADLWEEVPLYTREIRSVIFRSRPHPAWVYSRPVDGATPPMVDDVCEIPRGLVLEMARSFKRELVMLGKCPEN
jgi:hypothetical protein